MSEEVLANFKHRDTLAILADGVDLQMKSKNIKKAVKKLSAHVDYLGASKLLLILTKKTLVSVAVDFGARLPVKHISDPKERKAVEKLELDEKNTFVVNENNVDFAVHNKGTVQKALRLAIADSETPFAFFEALTVDVLREICVDVDGLTPKESKKFDAEELVEGISENIVTCGLEHLFGAFGVAELKTFVAERKLKVQTNSKETIIDCLIEGNNFTKTTTKRVKEKRSKKKPELAPGIRRIDLQCHFKRQELVEYCREEGRLVSGTKNELINRILKYHNGDLKSTAPKENKRSKSRS